MNSSTTAVRERPIILNTEMVQAILDGRKTQTRRVIKKHPDAKFQFINGVDGRSEWKLWSGMKVLGPRCPYGQPGDRLWVRETFFERMKNPCLGGSVRDVWYRADDKYGDVRWKPSIHMPRWASRITLEVTDVRAERVQEISTDDIVAEGTPPMKGILCENNIDELTKPSDGTRSPLFWSISFRELWDSINKKRGFGWDANPWVWAITFKRM